MTRPATIGFDRKVLLTWLNTAVVSVQKVGANAKLKAHLLEQLDGQGLGAEARDKTATVLAHLWGTVPPKTSSLRDDGMRLWEEIDSAERVALHWGMALATYPFFRDVADVCGRLLQLQPAVTVGQVERRIIQQWGDRSTVRRAAQRVIRSIHAWGLLGEGGSRGAYVRPAAMTLSREVAEWLLSASLMSRPNARLPMSSFLESPLLFPFDLRITPQQVRQSPRFEVEREGVDVEMVTARESPTGNVSPLKKPSRVRTHVRSREPSRALAG